MDHLPEELLLIIYSYLDIESISQLYKASKHLWHIIFDKTNNQYWIHYARLHHFNIKHQTNINHWLAEMKTNYLLKLYDLFSKKPCFYITCPHKTILGGDYCDNHDIPMTGKNEAEERIFNKKLKFAGIDLHYFENQHEKDYDDGHPQCTIRKINNDLYAIYFVSTDYYFSTKFCNIYDIYKFLYNKFVNKLVIKYQIRL